MRIMSRIKIRQKNVIGPTLTKLRTGMNLSQEELAAKCQRLGWDIARDTIAKIEGRNRLVADYEILLLASAMQVNPTAFFPFKVNLRHLMPADGIRKQEADAPTNKA